MGEYAVPAEKKKEPPAFPQIPMQGSGTYYFSPPPRPTFTDALVETLFEYRNHAKVSLAIAQDMVLATRTMDGMEDLGPKIWKSLLDALMKEHDNRGKAFEAGDVLGYLKHFPFLAGVSPSQAGEFIGAMADSYNKAASEGRRAEWLAENLSSYGMWKAFAEVYTHAVQNPTQENLNMACLTFRMAALCTALDVLTFTAAAGVAKAVQAQLKVVMQQLIQQVRLGMEILLEHLGPELAYATSSGSVRASELRGFGAMMENTLDKAGKAVKPTTGGAAARGSGDGVAEKSASSQADDAGKAAKAEDAAKPGEKTPPSEQAAEAAGATRVVPTQLLKKARALLAELDLPAEQKAFFQQQLEYIEKNGISKATEKHLEQMKRMLVKHGFSEADSEVIGTLLGVSEALEYAPMHHTRPGEFFSVFAKQSDTGVDAAKFQRDMMLHDVGKDAVPDSLLRGAEDSPYRFPESGHLTDDGWRTIHSHPGLGMDMLEQLGRKGVISKQGMKLVREAKPIILGHHSYGGIPVEAVSREAWYARAFDTIDAMAGKRRGKPYPNSKTFDRMLHALEGPEYDSAVNSKVINWLKSFEGRVAYEWSYGNVAELGFKSVEELRQFTRASLQNAAQVPKFAGRSEKEIMDALFDAMRESKSVEEAVAKFIQ